MYVLSHAPSTHPTTHFVIHQAWLQQFGYDKGDGTYAITTSDESLVVSILSAGTFFGALLAAPAGDFLGRRFGCVPFPRFPTRPN